ncbi:MAG TPA: hypothetical protein VMS65_14310 [Polyangiaceae bacterium]|nr:hypothetical protein [Polyangiaceae bacterium]
MGIGVFALSFGAVAQSKGRGLKRPPPTSSSKASAPSASSSAEPSKEPAPAKETTTNEEAPPADPATSGDDLGAPPPKTTEQKSGTQPSPLTPGPGEFPTGAPKPPPVQYDKLLADIAALRSRVAAVTTTLFSSKLRVVVELDGDDARVASFKVTLDDGIVYAAPDRFSPGEPQVVYEHAVASGHHVVGVEIERYDARNREYRSFQTSKFAIVVPESKRLETSFTVEDDSDIAEDFPDDQDGEYELSVKLRAMVID